jgi:hypothetical protein
MGRIAELCGEIAEWAEEGAEGLVLPEDAWERLRSDFTDDEIEDGLKLVQDTLFQTELVDSADSLSARLVEVLGAFGGAEEFRRVESVGAWISLEVIAHLTRRVARLEETLEAFREGAPPDRRGFDALRRRLADQGIEEEMQADREAELEPEAEAPEDEGDSE